MRPHILRLLIKSAILMPTAKKDDIIVVEIESEGYNKEKVSTKQNRICNFSEKNLCLVLATLILVSLCSSGEGASLGHESRH